jgi:hypothetical protein
MGGGQTLSIGFANLDKFCVTRVFSSGFVGGNRASNLNDPTGEERHNAVLNNPNSKDGLELFWFATGKDDFVLDRTRATVDLLRNTTLISSTKKPTVATSGSNSREYFREFAPQLFQ